MKCKHCVHYWADVEGDIPTCHADPNWPAPCEYDDFEKEEKNMSISLYDFIQQSEFPISLVAMFLRHGWSVLSMLCLAMKRKEVSIYDQSAERFYL